MNNDLEFLDTYWGLLKEHTDNLCNDIRNYKPEIGTPYKGSSILKILKYSDLEDTWSVTNKSYALCSLANKIEHMVFRINSAYDVKAMLTKIATGRLKKLYHVDKHKHKHDNGKYIIGREILGTGHFRFDWKAIKLTHNELEHLNKVLVKHGYTKEANGTD